MTTNFDVIVVGSGPGGATVAREMARTKKRVLILEKGKYHRGLGTYPGALSMLDRAGFYKSREGLNMLKVTTVGGATMLYSGSAAMPPAWLKSKYGIDLESYAQAVCRELNVSVLPPEYLGAASRAVMEAGNRLGQEWEPMPKFIDLKKVKNGRISGANTSLGQNFGERWTARDYIREAVDAGAELMTQADCRDVIVEGRTAVGVRVGVKGRPLQSFHADRVVLAAGGIPTPVLLKRAGVNEAGQGCVVDPTVLVYGICPSGGTYRDPLVSVVTWKWYDSDGIRLGTLIDPWVMTLIGLVKNGWQHAFKIVHYRKMIGILVKVKDEIGGWVNEKGEVSKALTAADKAKMDKGVALARDVLMEAGCPARTIVAGEIRGAHPSGTCRIGQVLDENLAVRRIKNLFVCDASVFPEALDRPTVVTIIAFGKRLARHLLENDGPSPD